MKHSGRLIEAIEKHVRSGSPVLDSPVERERKTLPKGDGKWEGYDHVYAKISSSCEKMARCKGIYLSDEHVRAMAVLGSGHEETMKYEMARLHSRGF